MQVSYSQRLTLWASCPMNLRKFPLDSQHCALQIGSFGYTAGEVCGVHCTLVQCCAGQVVYRWQAKPYSIGEDVALAQFHLARASHAEAVRAALHWAGNTVRMKFWTVGLKLVLTL